MKLTLFLDDDAYETYAALAKSAGQKPETLVARFLAASTAFADPAQRVLFVDASSRDRLEAACGGGQLRSGPDLATKVEKLARLRIGDVVIPLTSAQLEDLRRKAIANSRTFEDYCTMVFTQIAQEYMVTV